MSIDFSQLRDFLVAIAQTDLTELTLKSQDFELTLRKEKPALISPVAVATVSETVAPLTTAVQQKQQATTESTVTPSPSPIEKKWVGISSPMVGTFYRAPAPGESAFVELNDRVRTGQTVCIIEAMKLMNEIEAEVSGQIVEVAVENGQPVEYGQVLMWINPD